MGGVSQQQQQKKIRSFFRSCKKKIKLCMAERGGRCKTCDIGFYKQRALCKHYESSGWHEYNGRRQEAGHPPVTEAEFLATPSPVLYVCRPRGKGFRSSKAHLQHLDNDYDIGNVASLLLYVAPIWTFARVMKKKSIEEFSLQVFSAFGFVHKISNSAKDALDGTSSPRCLNPDLGTCLLKITYSAYPDLTVKFQSHCSRNYSNPMLPVVSSAIDATGQFSLGLDGKKIEHETNVHLASIKNTDMDRDRDRDEGEHWGRVYNRKKNKHGQGL